MNETILLFVLGGYAAAIAWIVIYILNHNNDLAKIEGRLIKVETVLAFFSEKTAKILHSPHTPELDALLEKYCNRYYDLSNLEWKRLREICDEMENDGRQSKEVRVLAAWLSVVSQHKLKLPPPTPKKHAEEPNQL